MSIFSRKSAHEEKRKNSKNLFLSGVLVLTVANLLVKLIGLVFKVQIVNILGDLGMGYFNFSYQFYTVFFMISTSGLPIAVALMISESRAQGNFKQSRLVYRVAMKIFLLFGLAGTAIMILSSHLYSTHILKSPNAAYSIIAIAPALFFICVTSAMRGYFQGHQQMAPTALSQFIEAACKLVVGIPLAMWGIHRGYEIQYVAALAILGLTVGTALGMFILCIIRKFFNEDAYNLEYATNAPCDLPVESQKHILKRLAKIAIPITISASAMSITGLIDGIIVQGRLMASGLTELDATATYGNYTGLAVALFNLPPILIYPISTSLVPMISASLASKNFSRAKHIMESSLRIASIIAIPCGLGLSVMAKPILKLLFNAESAEKAAPLLTVLGVSSFSLCLLGVTNAILQACKQERKPIWSILSGSVVKLIFSSILIGIPSIRMFGAPIGTFFCYLVMLVMNFYFIAKYAHITPNIRRVFVRPLLSSTVCMVVAVGVYTVGVRYLLFVPEKLVTLLAIAIAALVYVIFIFLTKSVQEEDIRLLPKSDKILALLTKLKLIRV